MEPELRSEESDANVEGGARFRLPTRRCPLKPSKRWKGKVRPIPGNSPHDRPVSRVISCSSKRVCDDPFSTTPWPPMPARAACVFKAWRNLSVRWGSKTKNKTKTVSTRAGVPPPVGRPPLPGKGRDGRNYAPCSSSAMSSGRLFLDRVARQQSPSPLYRQPEHNTHFSGGQAQGDISILPGRGHFYFALTGAFRRTDNARRE